VQGRLLMSALQLLHGAGKAFHSDSTEAVDSSNSSSSEERQCGLQKVQGLPEGIQRATTHMV
jgi:hypothetical protein